MTERAQNADFRRKPQIFADSPFLLEIPAFGGRRKPQKTADFRRKPKIFAENRRKPQIGLRHLRCVTFSSALNTPLIRFRRLGYNSRHRSECANLAVGAYVSWFLSPKRIMQNHVKSWQIMCNHARENA